MNCFRLSRADLDRLIDFNFPLKSPCQIFFWIYSTKELFSHNLSPLEAKIIAVFVNHLLSVNLHEISWVSVVNNLFFSFIFYMFLICYMLQYPRIMFFFVITPNAIYRCVIRISFLLYYRHISLSLLIVLFNRICLSYFICKSIKSC